MLSHVMIFCKKNIFILHCESIRWLQMLVWTLITLMTSAVAMRFWPGSTKPYTLTLLKWSNVVQVQFLLFIYFINVYVHVIWITLIFISFLFFRCVFLPAYRLALPRVHWHEQSKVWVPEEVWFHPELQSSPDSFPEIRHNRGQIHLIVFY